MSNAEFQTSYVDSAVDIASVVRARRVVLDLTQQQLAEKAGVGRRSIIDFEAGKETLQIDTVFKVCFAVNIELLVRQPILSDRDLIRVHRRLTTSNRV